MSNFQGKIEVEKQDDGSYKLSQLLLINQKTEVNWFNARAKAKDIPAFSSMTVHRDLDGPINDMPWNYRRLLEQ